MKVIFGVGVVGSALVRVIVPAAAIVCI
jgi:hypothetical protein